MEMEKEKDLNYRFVEYPGVTVGRLVLNYIEDYAEERPFTSVYLVFIADGNVAAIEGEAEMEDGTMETGDLPDAGLAEVVRQAVEAELARRRAGFPTRVNSE